MRELHQRRKLPALVLTGSQDQKARLTEFLHLLTEASDELGRKTQIVLPPNLQDFIDLLAAAECVLTVDTAAAHAATALDCRTFVLFSGKHQGMFAPWIRSSRQQWLLPKPSFPLNEWHEAHDNEGLLHDIEGLLLR